ncbi:hypothetical protein ACFOLK_18450 [Marinococcus halophilus]|nr:hypothetical protein [Marinococcus halophilus]
MKELEFDVLVKQDGSFHALPIIIVFIPKPKEISLAFILSFPNGL